MSAEATIPETISLTEHVTSFSLDAHVSGACFLGETVGFALGDGRVVLRLGEEAREIAAHAGAVQVFAHDADALYTGGDDGRLLRIEASGTVETIADEKGKWIDALALSPAGALAWSAGRSVKARDKTGAVKEITAPSSVRGLAFAPKGYRLAYAHNGGASLWFPNAASPPELFDWKGSHLDVTFSPDGRFLVTSMQENALHGWKLADRKHMRMTGYPAKSRSLSWTHDGKWLATSGAEACILWPFADKDGPMGKAPRECGVRRARVTAVASHPKAPVTAIGYDDGCVLMCRLSDGAELLVRRASAFTGAISALAWNDAGARLAFGTGQGAAGWLDLPPMH
ncbi:MAG TPA: WD40 repeat domain-containing protein [Beijerinckiaceae bacterium]|nr:WD40 repeat domain-containing protein [Beijerinckiaceae bacterium]